MSLVAFNMSHYYLTHSSTETKKTAGFLAEKIIKERKIYIRSKERKIRSASLVVALAGDLGSGKTTFIQGFCRKLGVRKKIISPTFVLIKNYELRIKNYEGLRRIYHIDCYRIKKFQELLKLGLKEILNNPQNIVLIEWPEKIKKILHKKTIWIEFGYGQKENERKIILATKYE